MSREAWGEGMALAGGAVRRPLRSGVSSVPRRGWDTSRPRQAAAAEAEDTIARLQQEPELRAQLLSEHVWDPTAKWRPTAGTPVPQEGETVEQAFFALMDYALVRKTEGK